MPRIRKKEDIPRDLAVAGDLSLAFVNTGLPRIDRRRKDPTVEPAEFSRLSELGAWLQKMGALNAENLEALRLTIRKQPEEAAEAFDSLLELRKTLRLLFTDQALGKPPKSAHVDTLNAAIGRGAPSRVLVFDGERCAWEHVEGRVPFASLFDCLAVAAADLLVSDMRQRIRQCGSRGCQRLFVAKSPRRLWCNPRTCGNRLKGKRFYKDNPGRRNRHIYSGY